jgi:hypothetical protein
MGILTLIVNVFLYIGCQQETRHLIIPWLIVEIIGIAALFTYAVAYFAMADEFALLLGVERSVVILAGVFYVLVMGEN